jgi:hypothetical protein
LALPPLRRVPRDWALAFLRPGLATFEQIAAPMEWTHVGISLGLSGLATGLLRLLGSLWSGQEPVTAFLGGAVGNVVLFSIIAAVLLFAARLSRGRGPGIDHMYVLSVIWPVINILLAVPAFDGTLWLPVCLWLPATLYGLYLSYFAMRAVHGFDARPARLVAFSPLLLALTFTGCFLCAYLALATQTQLVATP